MFLFHMLCVTNGALICLVNKCKNPHGVYQLFVQLLKSIHTCTPQHFNNKQLNLTDYIRTYVHNIVIESCLRILRCIWSSKRSTLTIILLQLYNFSHSINNCILFHKTYHLTFLFIVIIIYIFHRHNHKTMY